MHPEEIKAALRMKGVTPTALAEEMGVANGTMSQVISGRSVSARIRARISETIGKPVDAIWQPSTRPILRRKKSTHTTEQAPAV